MSKKVIRATKLEFLTWFYQSADFGPASSDVRARLKRRFIAEQKKRPPIGFDCCDYCGEEWPCECT